MDQTDGEDPGIPLTSSEAMGRKLRPSTAGPDERGCVRFDAIDVGDICYLGPCDPAGNRKVCYRTADGCTECYLTDKWCPPKERL